MNGAQTEQGSLRGVRPGTLLALVIVGVVLAGSVMVYLRGRQPLLLTRVPGRVVQMQATDAGLFWLEWQDGADPTGLNSALRFLSRPGEPPTTLFEGTNLLRFACQGEGVFLLQGGPRSKDPYLPYPQGCLLQGSLSGGSPTVVAQGLINPGDLWVDDQAFYWTETYPPRAPAVNHVPALQYLTLIRTCPRSGSVSPTFPRLAQIESSQPFLQGQLLGVAGGSLYWLEKRYAGIEPGMSFVRRVALTGGPIETLASTLGRQTATLTGTAVYLTAYSLESAPAPAYRVVYRYSLTGGDPVLLTDWLNASGVLLWREPYLYYVDTTGLWQVPLAWGPPQQLNHRLSGAQAGEVRAGFFFAALGVSGGPNAGTHLKQQPVTLAAWIRNALGG